MSRDQRHKRRGLSQSQAAAVLLLPFLAVYAAFLVYPFFMGVWISLHDWNLLAVAFNPGAKEFIGVENYVRTLWGRNIEWGLFASPVMQTVGVLGIGLAFLGYRQGRLTRATALAIGIAGALFFLLPGFHPGEDGRWYDRRFWPTVGNTILFVGLAVPGVTITALILAAALDGETRAKAILRTIFFLSQVLSVTVVTLIWQIMFSPRQGLIANVTEALGGSPIVWLTDQQFAMAAIVITTVWWSLGIAMILFLAGHSGHLERHLRGRRHRRRARGQGVLVHHAAEPEADDHACRGAADHPAFSGLRAVASDDARRTERQHAGSGALHLPDRLPRQRAGQGQRHGGLPLRDHGRVFARAVRRGPGGGLR
jgi:ABC-type sugar transport system permease subunit